MSKTLVHYDGKAGRGCDAEIIYDDGNRLLISFSLYAEDGMRTAWFRKIRKYNGGIFATKDLNYIYYRRG